MKSILQKNNICKPRCAAPKCNEEKKKKMKLEALSLNIFFIISGEVIS